MYIKPWSKESENYFRRLAKDRIIYTKDIEFTRTLGKRYPSLFEEDNGFLDIGRIKKTSSSMIALRPGNIIAPKPNRRKFLQFDFYKIY